MIAAPEYKTRLNIADGENHDIIQTIHKNFPRAIEQLKLFAPSLIGDDRTETARNIFNFLKQNVKYLKDDSEAQLIRMPSRFIADGEGDCKSFALFTAGALAALKMPVNFRYTSYSHSPIPSHVYTTTTDENGNEIIIDAVWNKFNGEKPYTNKIDKPMNVYTLSGTDDVGSFFSKAFDAIKTGVKKIGLAIPRRAYRSMIALNIHGMASKLLRSYKRNPNAVMSKWKKMGGTPSAFLQSIKIGAKRKSILGVGDTQEIGVIQFAAIAAAAVPLIAAFAPVIKALKGDHNNDGTPAKETPIEKVLSMAEGAARELGLPVYNADTEVNKGTVDIEKGKDDSPGFQLSPMVLIAAAAAIFLLIKKK